MYLEYSVIIVTGLLFLLLFIDIICFLVCGVIGIIYYFLGVAREAKCLYISNTAKLKLHKIQEYFLVLIDKIFMPIDALNSIFLGWLG